MDAPELPVIPIPPSRDIPRTQQGLVAKVYDRVLELEQDQEEAQEVEEQGDRIEISAGARSFEAARVLVKRTFANLGEGPDQDAELYARAGKAEFEARFERQADFSPEGTADLILSGIQGYIYGAFELENPRPSAGDLDRFGVETGAGVVRGYQEARQELRDSDLSGRQVESDAVKSVGLVLDGLDRFVGARRSILTPTPDKADA